MCSNFLKTSPHCAKLRSVTAYVVVSSLKTLNKEQRCGVAGETIQWWDFQSLLRNFRWNNVTFMGPYHQCQALPSLKNRQINPPHLASIFSRLFRGLVQTTIKVFKPFSSKSFPRIPSASVVVPTLYLNFSWYNLSILPRNNYWQ